MVQEDLTAPVVNFIDLQVNNGCISGIELEDQFKILEDAKLKSILAFSTVLKKATGLDLAVKD